MREGISLATPPAFPSRFECELCLEHSQPFCDSGIISVRTKSVHVEAVRRGDCKVELLYKTGISAGELYVLMQKRVQ